MHFSFQKPGTWLGKWPYVLPICRDDEPIIARVFFSFYKKIKRCFLVIKMCIYNNFWEKLKERIKKQINYVLLTGSTIYI